EWRIETKTETACCIVKLRRRHAKVEQFAINLVHAMLAQRFAQMAETPMYQLQPFILDLPPRRNRRRVTVQRNQPSVPAQAFQYQSAVPARTVEDRKSTRLNSSHGSISYAVF